MQGQLPVSGLLECDFRSAWNDLKTATPGPIEQYAWWQACVDDLPGVGLIRPFFINANGKFLAIAPLVLQPGALPRFEMIGVRQLHEPMDFVYSSPETLAALCDKLVRQKIPIDLLRVPQHSPLVEALRRAFKGRGLIHASPTTPSPFLAIDQSWTTPEAHLNAGRRSDFRRAMRHAEKSGVVTFEIVTPDPGNLDRLLAEAYDTELHSWKGRRGSALAIDPLRSGFYRRYFHECMKQGILRLAFMRLDGQAIAMQIGVHTNNRLWLLKIGYKEAYARLSPGSLLMLEVVRDAAQRGLHSIEFLGAVEPWTELWTKTVRECLHIRAYPPGFLSAATFVADAGVWLLNRLRRSWQNVKI